MLDYLAYFNEWDKNWYEDIEELWNFDDKDIEAALIAMAFPKPEDPRVEELKKLILDRFDNDLVKYYEWSLIIRKIRKVNVPDYT